MALSRTAALKLWNTALLNTGKQKRYRNELMLNPQP